LTEHAFLTFYVTAILLLSADGLPWHSLCVRIRPVLGLEGKKYNFVLSFTMYQKNGNFLLLLSYLMKKMFYQVLTGINIAFPALMTIWMFFMPRSPVFLVEKVRKVIRKRRR
jgi:hypothetical protein